MPRRHVTVRFTRPPHLNDEEHALLRTLKEKPRPVSGVPKSMGARLWRWGYLKLRLMPSPDPNHYGAQVVHYAITEQGHRELATKPPPALDNVG